MVFCLFTPSYLSTNRASLRSLLTSSVLGVLKDESGIVVSTMAMERAIRSGMIGLNGSLGCETRIIWLGNGYDMMVVDATRVDSIMIV